MFLDQTEYDIRFEWGLNGVETLAPVSDVVVIVDVLSFTTSVDIAVSNGATVFPYAGNPQDLDIYAKSIRALVASRIRRDETAYSLSPASLLTISRGTRLVLPSPNGSILSLAAGNTPTLAGCLRNARTVAARAVQLGRHISVIGAGERWPDGTLRPAIEDMIGAGAVVANLPESRSPEAKVVAGVFHSVQGYLLDTLLRCSSGKELVEMGFPEDVRLASQWNMSQSAPQLIDGAYIND